MGDRRDGRTQLRAGQGRLESAPRDDDRGGLSPPAAPHLPNSLGPRGSAFEELAATDLGDQRFERLYEILAYTVLEGAATLVREAQVGEDLDARVADGVALLSRFVESVVDSARTDLADELLGEGLRSNGPLYSLGRDLAGAVALREGPRAVGTLLTRGPIAFVLRAQALTDSRAASKLSGRVMTAIRSLEARIQNRRAGN
jgi:hypothetical protein